MQIRTALLLVIFSGLLVFAGCKGGDLKQDAEQIGDLMCRNIEIAGKLRKINLNDTASANNLQKESENLQSEMTALYQEFRQKWGEKAKDKEFNKRFTTELRKAMLNCPHLSKEDREQFQKDLAE